MEFSLRPFTYKVSHKAKYNNAKPPVAPLKAWICSGMEAKNQEEKPLRIDSFRTRDGADCRAKFARGRFVPREVIATVITLIIILIILVIVLGALLGKARSKDLFSSRNVGENGELQISFSYL